MSDLILRIWIEQSVTPSQRKANIFHNFCFCFKDIQSIRITELNHYYTSGHSRKGSINHHVVQPKTPAVITGSGTKYFFEQANEAEKVWVTKFLDNIRQTQT